MSVLSIVPNSRVVGSLSDEEKLILTNDIEKILKAYKIILIFAWISVLILIGIFIVPAMYILITKTKNRLLKLHVEKLDIHEARGVLNTKYGVSRAGLTSLYMCYIDGNLIPSEVLPNPNLDPSGIQDHVNETITIRYVPAISRYHSYLDSSNRGYNFITKTPISG